MARHNERENGKSAKRAYREAKRFERQEQIQYLIKYLEDNPDRIVGLPSGERVPAKVALSLLQCGVLGAVARDLYKPTDKQVDTSYQSMKNFVDKNCNEQ